MNRKGFTLIELLAVIIIIAIIAVLIVPGIIKNVDTARENSYNILIKNIITSAQTYYEECEYGDLSNEIKYEEYACKIKKDSISENNYVEITLGTLANTGFLNIKDIDDNTNKKIVKDPKTDKDISDCTIIITKVVEPTTYKVTYQVVNNDTNNICPSIYK